MAAGDLNDDGIDDLILGVALGAGPSDARENGGEVYILYGRSVWPATLDLRNPDPATTNATPALHVLIKLYFSFITQTPFQSEPGGCCLSCVARST